MAATRGLVRALEGALCVALAGAGDRAAAALDAFFAGARLTLATLAGLAADVFFADFAAGFAAGFVFALVATVALTAVLRPALPVLVADEAGLVFAEGLALAAGRFAAGM